MSSHRATGKCSILEALGSRFSKNNPETCSFKGIAPGSVGMTPVFGSFSKLSLEPKISPLPKSTKMVFPLILLQRARRAISGAGSLAGSDTATLRPTKPRGWRGSVQIRAPGFDCVCWVEGCPLISGIAEVADDAWSAIVPSADAEMTWSVAVDATTHIEPLCSMKALA